MIHLAGVLCVLCLLPLASLSRLVGFKSIPGEGEWFPPCRVLHVRNAAQMSHVTADINRTSDFLVLNDYTVIDFSIIRNESALAKLPTSIALCYQGKLTRETKSFSSVSHRSSALYLNSTHLSSSALYLPLISPALPSTFHSSLQLCPLPSTHLSSSALYLPLISPALPST
ncbi:hypothetical protein RRG08_058758 [Elysia crispata]|uniref:Uncharacterized protein n=1 Tax=Elysia crispata TaxID=231223 RepID=A0AAE1D6R9_9GAST|nr:hypothetical protein RRG08_058758 [Elysia crispata]